MEEQPNVVAKMEAVDPDKAHRFVWSSRMPGRCGVCGRKQSHTIHRRPKFHAYAPKEVVNGRYEVDERGCFRRVQQNKE